MDTRTTRLPNDLIEAAEIEGRAEHRSTAKQIEHWARFGMFFDRQTNSSRRIQSAIAGRTPLRDLDEAERAVADATINARISAAANETSFADRLAAQGLTTVLIDEQSNLVRRYPDGSTTVL